MNLCLMNYRQNKYRYITLNVDSYAEHIFRGRIWHEALSKEAEFAGWIDLMMIVNQIYDRTNIPRRTLDLRTFESVEKKSLRWRSAENEHMSSSHGGALMTFRIFMAYRYHASWQGSVYCQKQNEHYKFASFLELLSLLDCLMKGFEPVLHTIEQGQCSCQLSVNGYGGSKSTFSVRILYYQNREWQGYIYCRELKKEKAFRSFMEMLYLIASVLDEHTAVRTKDNSSGTDTRDDTYMIG